MDSKIHGWLPMYKPIGPTSHDVVDKVRSLLGNTIRVGHCGTLDPGAHGILVLALGHATRFIQHVPKHKRYAASVRFGVATDTLDLEGSVLRSSPCPHLTEEVVETACSRFVGRLQQKVPVYSACKHKGQPLHRLARSGKFSLEELEAIAPIKEVEVTKLSMRAFRHGDHPEIDIDVCCQGGTFIRSLARDIGVSLGVDSVMAALERTECGSFGPQSTPRVYNVNDVEACVKEGPLSPLPTNWPFNQAGIASIHLPKSRERSFPSSGVQVGGDYEAEHGEMRQVFDSKGVFRGLGRFDGDRRRVLPVTLIV